MSDVEREKYDDKVIKGSGRNVICHCITAITRTLYTTFPSRLYPTDIKGPEATIIQPFCRRHNACRKPRSVANACETQERTSKQEYIEAQPTHLLLRARETGAALAAAVTGLLLICCSSTYVGSLASSSSSESSSSSSLVALLGSYSLPNPLGPRSA